VGCGGDFCPAATEICDAGTCRTCTVCPTCTYTTVQAAIDAANPGDTIFICAGIYLGNLSIPKPLTLVGAGDGDDQANNTILQGTGGGAVVDIPINGPDQNVALRDLRITGGATRAAAAAVSTTSVPP
jgi:pectin methylesterase-like acyl-CoA thioesterase